MASPEGQEGSISTNDGATLNRWRTLDPVELQSFAIQQEKSSSGVEFRGWTVEPSPKDNGKPSGGRQAEHQERRQPPLPDQGEEISPPRSCVLVQGQAQAPLATSGSPVCARSRM